jgi:riboflavin kinase/FMN adenylyltransferase
VYASELVFLDEGEPRRGARFGAVANVGRRPTFEIDGPVVVEAHLLDFDGQVYDRRAELSFRHRLRDERRFENAEALRTQIAADAAEARRRLEEA